MILLDHDYHVVEFNRPVPNEVIDWLNKRFGPCNGDLWFLRHNRLYFSNSKDHLMFILTWGDR